MLEERLPQSARGQRLPPGVAALYRPGVFANPCLPYCAQEAGTWGIARARPSLHDSLDIRPQLLVKPGPHVSQPRIREALRQVYRDHLVDA